MTQALVNFTVNLMINYQHKQRQFLSCNNSVTLGAIVLLDSTGLMRTVVSV